jgi:hypothetical protein
MVRIAMLGDPGSGGTTVLGLLYAAQVRMSAAEVSTFRFHVAPSAMSRLGVIFEQLRAGEFPSHASGASSEPVEFLFERRPTLVASLRGRLGGGHGATDGARTVEWTRATFDDLRRHLEGGGYPTDGARQLEGTDVLLVLVPPSPAGPPGAPAKPGADEALVQMLSERDRSSRAGKSGSTIVAFVFTMLDRVAEGRRKELGLPSNVQDPIPSERRTAIGSRLLEESFPRTRARLLSQPSAHSSPGSTPHIFFSWIETEASSNGRLRLRSAPGGGWEPAYPFDEYVALIGACGGWAEGRT